MKAYQPQETRIPTAIGLHILTVSGEHLTFTGPVTYKYFDDCGAIFYCDGRSFMPGCVYEVLMG
jgi:hypothetical protein